MKNHEYRRLLSSDSLCGTKVVNTAGEDLGKIEDFMINVQTGKIEYGVLSFGGFMGIGDTLHAIPWASLTVNEANEEFILDIPKERLEGAPGFDKNHWPDFADQTYLTSLNTYYGMPYSGQQLDLTGNPNNPNYNPDSRRTMSR
jgi:sporulation protein YlmC with PRC-barrel domain